MKNGKRMDKVGFASTIIMCISIIYLLIEIFYKVFKTSSLGAATWEIILFLIIVCLYGLLTKDEVAFNIPKTLLGSTISLSSNKKKERNNIYLLDAMVFALFLCTMDVLVYVFVSPDKAILLIKLINGYELFNLIFNLLVIFICATLVFFACDNFSTERNLKVYIDYLKTFKKNKSDEELKLKDKKKTNKKA